ncbi:hypothetical protein TraAM80_04705 [Trypanosoma rangeli]|uniref:Uncharacterized protein n=1 Tax=Trypanosoma rangeli TaxID=5698 RepID=A0A422NI49_TRYRA|nr:uncharacterized protein TraAM80_04705 [Trypanosoma rangeli]RNF05145.1 hypothetical protein TraAM80_04705 [Trypanosoma rangeli]|eukprot:RNF05145.1 hypothetical protein TraAM80_04705 [Trypanosoma rangeli]
MYSKVCPAPKNSTVRSTEFTGSVFTATSLVRGLRNESVPGAAFPSASKSPYAEAESRGEEGNSFFPSDVIIPFHLGIASRLMEQQRPMPSGQNEGLLQESDVLELQRSLDDYSEGLAYATRRLFMHDNENMVQRLQEAKKVSTISLFLQMQREMRQLTGDNSADKERGLIQRLSDHLEL